MLMTSEREDDADFTHPRLAGSTWITSLYKPYRGQVFKQSHCCTAVPAWFGKGEDVGTRQTTPWVLLGVDSRLPILEEAFLLQPIGMGPLPTLKQRTHFRTIERRGGIRGAHPLCPPSYVLNYFVCISGQLTRTRHLVFSVPDSFSSPVDRPRDLARQLAALLRVPV